MAESASHRVAALREIQESRPYQFQATNSRTADGLSTAWDPSEAAAGRKQNKCHRSNNYDSHRERRLPVGVQSDAFKPYMPLGTPLVSRMGHEGRVDGVDTANRLQDDDALRGYYRPKLGVPIPSDAVVNAGGERIYQSKRSMPLGINGYEKLREAIMDSNSRKMSVRNGATLNTVIQVAPGKDLLSRKRKSNTRTQRRKDLKLPPIPGVQADNHEVDDEPTKRLDLMFNPAHTVMERQSEFEEIRNQAIRRLEKSLNKLDESRGSIYQSKMHALTSNLPDGHTGHTGFQQWRLQAEKHRLEAQLRAYETHAWFLKLVGMLTEHGRHMTYPEEHIIGEIKKIIEMGESFDVLDFLTMVSCVPRSYHENDLVKPIFDFLRAELKMTPLEYKQFLEQRGLPISQELMLATRAQSIRLRSYGQNQSVASTGTNESSGKPLGPRDSSASSTGGENSQRLAYRRTTVMTAAEKEQLAVQAAQLSFIKSESEISVDDSD